MSRPYAPTPGSKAEQLVQFLANNNGAMRTKELAKHTGITCADIPSLLATAVEHGLVTMCKVSQPGTRPGNEYRIGPGFNTDRPTLKPMKPTIIPVREHEGKVIDKPMPKPGAAPRPIYPAEQAQPEVAHNTGSDPQGTLQPLHPAEVAVAAPVTREATPEPKVKVRELGPASRKAPAGNEIGILIDKNCAVDIYTDDFYIELTPEQAATVGKFFHATQNLWRR
jgi:hypothetical protein